MSKHTPGQWIANAKHVACENQAEIVIEQDGGSAPIAKAFQIYGDQLQANARLIAAAPELLDALQKAVRFGGLFPDLRAEVEAVIAKATGG